MGSLAHRTFKLLQIGLKFGADSALLTYLKTFGAVNS
jgi:hypothetical protein